MYVMFDKPFNNELSKYTFRPNTTLEGQVKTKQGSSTYTISMTANNTNVCPVFAHHTTNASSYSSNPFLGFTALFGTEGMTYSYTFLAGGVELTKRNGSVRINANSMGTSNAACIRIFANQVDDLSL